MSQVPIAVLTSDRQTRRQIVRALRSGGMELTILETAAQAEAMVSDSRHRLLVLDCENSDSQVAEAILQKLSGSPQSMPVVLLSLKPDKAPMMKLLEKYDISHLVAKHGAIRVSKAASSRPPHPLLDERELLVTCEKVLSRDIFGVDKYISSWGVQVYKHTINGMREKGTFLDRFERYLHSLEVPASVLPEMVTVAEEFVLNAIIHAPRLPDGTPKYEHLGPTANLVLEPGEEVEVSWGCDGQRLLVSVSDRFGGLDKKTLYEYLRRSFHSEMEPETKASGAGLGLSLALRSIHQLIFNVHDRVRTEAIAGWYLRVQSAHEFKQVGKSLNVFWLPNQPRVEARVPARPDQPFAIEGRIDELTDFEAALLAKLVDVRRVTSVSSRGLVRWVAFIRQVQGRGVELVGLPDSLLFQATTVAGVVKGVKVLTVVVPFECDDCGFEERRELAPDAVLTTPGGKCPECGEPMVFAGVPAIYQSFLKVLRRDQA